MKPRESGYPRPMQLTGNLRSIAGMTAAMAMFSCMDAMLKVLAGAYPSAQVTAMRGLASLPLVFAWVAMQGGFGQVFNRHLRWPLHLLRAVFGLMTMILFTTGLRSMGLAEAYTLTFISPMVVTLLAAPVLGERVQLHHWLALIVCLLGVLVALRPDQSGFLTLGALAVLGAAVTYATGSVIGRLLSRTDPAVSLVFWSTASLAIGGLALSWSSWVPVKDAHWPVLLGIGVVGFVAQVTITDAFRHGQASTVAPFEYSALAWAVLIDWFIWHQLPDRYTLLGAAIIVGSGLYVLRRIAPDRPVVVMPPP
jgi:drug/metabolite transporter (DMT)-like permease